MPGQPHSTSHARGNAIRALYVLVFLFVGGHGNFFALWLDDAGWSESHIGWLDSVKYLAIIVFPVLWGRFADTTGDPPRILKLICVGSLLCFVPLCFSSELLVVFAAVALFSAFRVGIIPVADTVTLTHCQATGTDYGRFRIWGSWGFIAGGFLVGGVVAATSRGAIPWALTGLLLLTTGIAWFLKTPGRRSSAKTLNPRELLQVPGFRGFLLLTFLWRLSAQGLYLFLPLHLSDLGVGDAVLPVFWAVGVMSEIILLRNAQRLFGHRRPIHVLIFCYVCCVLQFALTAWVTSAAWLLVVMTLHGVTFGVAYYTSVLWLADNVDPAHRTTAQAVFQSLGFGVGGAISAAGAGVVFELGRGPLLYSVAAGLSLLTLVVAVVIARRRAAPRPPIAAASGPSGPSA